MNGTKKWPACLLSVFLAGCLETWFVILRCREKWIDKFTEELLCKVGETDAGFESWKAETENRMKDTKKMQAISTSVVWAGDLQCWRTKGWFGLPKSNIHKPQAVVCFLLALRPTIKSPCRNEKLTRVNMRDYFQFLLSFHGVHCCLGGLRIPIKGFVRSAPFKGLTISF